MTIPVPMPLMRFCEGVCENSSSMAAARTVRVLWILTTASRTRRTTSTTGVYRGFQVRDRGCGETTGGPREVPFVIALEGRSEDEGFAPREAAGISPPRAPDRVITANAKPSVNATINKRCVLMNL